ncbi:flagellar protein FlgN [Naasia lichenicola]|uniref:Flagellar protein FlgN n=1 Tax=Naasia lichenicola TaxID=2565933 RepID=A0A4S4FIJ1_9MICO|nr:flagellar protein FlgN [Naasia lichenicola]THG29662.1 flagellar protein FlgN [Naasia lichenicola]
MGVNELSTLLWRERELLELLMFKLDEEQLLLTSGKSKWLPYATREVEQVLTRLRKAGIERTVEASAVAMEWGIGDEATLRELSDHSPTDAWRDILSSHLTALTSLTQQIASVRDINLQYLRAATRATQETLAGLNADRGVYDGRGANATVSSHAHLFDRQI